MSEKNHKHGYAKKGQTHPLYRKWSNMKTRCYNQNSKKFQNWGGRGITVCGDWLNDPKAFIEWGLTNGWERGLLIDRIDNNGNYTPENCRFVTPAESNRNRRQPKPYKKSSNLPTGVYPNKKRFMARIKVAGKKIYLGTFSTPEEASDIFQSAKRQKQLYAAEGCE